MPTDDFGNPYPALTDAPNVPAALLALVLNLAKYPRANRGKVIGPASAIADITTLTGAQPIIALTNVPITAGRRYRIYAQGQGSNITANGVPMLRVDLSGVVTAADWFRPYWLNLTVPASGSSSTTIYSNGHKTLDATVTGTLTITLTGIQTVAGSGYRPGVNTHELTIDDIGPAI